MSISTVSPCWVAQEEAYGCGAAAVAMLTGRTYAEVKGFIGGDLKKAGRGGHESWDSLLADYGYAVARKYRCRTYAGDDREVWPPEPFGDAHLCEVDAGGPGSHMVVMLADGTVLDPGTPAPRRLADYARVYNVAAVTRYKDEPRLQIGAGR